MSSLFCYEDFDSFNLDEDCQKNDAEIEEGYLIKTEEFIIFAIDKNELTSSRNHWKGIITDNYFVFLPHASESFRVADTFFT